MRICSEEWKLRFDSKHGGGSCDSGKREIVVGIKDCGFREIVEILVHEIIEGTLLKDGKRFAEFSDLSTPDQPTRRELLFMFDHDYLCDPDSKLVDSLLSSGFFKIVDGRKRKKKKK